MTTAIFEHGQWSEEEYLTLGETQDRVELFDGSLYVSPSATPRHQHISRMLANALDPGARQAGLHVHLAINVRLTQGRVPIPDLAVTSKIDFTDLVVPGSAVRLVCEVISPSNASMDRVLKMHYYASAAIEWYLLVDQETAALQLYRLNGAHYLEHSVTKPGSVLTLTEPVRATIDPLALLP